MVQVTPLRRTLSSSP